jgi:uncharacterized protein (TIGR03663 family)
MLLVFFTALTIGAGWRYVQTGRARWVVILGAGVGLMFATKETFVLNVAAMGAASASTWWATRETKYRIAGAENTKRLGAPRIGATRFGFVDPNHVDFEFQIWNRKYVAAAFAGMFIVWLLFFSSFFTHFAGLADSLRTYLPWLKRAGGHSPHIHPWYFYLQRLAWFHPVKGPVWSEGLILVLAVVGAVVSFRGNKSPLHKFLAFYTIILTALYSAISYKTPWCLLNFLLGMILLAGVGAASLLEFFQARAAKVAVAVVLIAFALQLAWQAQRASFVFAADRRNPYVYAQTVPDILNLVRRSEGIARVAPAGFDTIIKVIAPESDYWPLPWYLRRFKHVGFYEKIPDEPFAPIIIVSSKLDARLDEKSDKKWIMVGLTELRPGKFFEQYVELELWKKYVATLPRDRE